MAEYTINHNIFEGRGAQKNIGRPSKSAGVDETKLAKEIGKVMDKISKSANKSLSNELSKQLEISLRRLLRSQQVQGPAGRPAQKPITKTDLERIIKNVSIDTTNSILKEMAKSSSRAAGPTHTRSIEAVFKNMDKQITAAIGKLNTSLSRKAGVELGSQGTKIIADSIGKAIRSTVSTELGKSIQDASKTYQSIQRSAKATENAIRSIAKLKKSGGGIDVTEIPKIVKSLMVLGKEAKGLSNDYKELRTSVKTLTKEQKGIMKELGDAVRETKAKMAAKFQTIKDLPSKFTDMDRFKKIFDDFLQKFEKISRQIEAEYKPTQLQLPGPSRDAFKEIAKLIDVVRKESRSELVKITKDVQAGRKDVAILENFRKERDAIIKAIESLKPTEIKEAAGKGLPGLNVKILDRLRSLVNEVQKKIDKPPQTSDKEIAAGLKEASKKLSGAADVLEKSTQQLPKATTIRTQPSPGPAAKDVSPLIKNIELLNSKLRGPQSISVYPEVALPATKKGLDLKFEGMRGAGQEKQKKIIEARINDLSSSLVDLQDYIVNTLNTEFKKAGDRWTVVREGTEKGIQDFFKIVAGGNIKESGKQFAFDIADIASIKKQLFLKGRGAATKGTPAAMVRELTDALATELAANFPSPANLTGKIAEWLKSVTIEQIKQIDEIKRFQSRLVTIKQTDIKGVLPSENLIKQLTDVLGRDRATLEQVFKSTVGRAEAGKTLRERKLVRTVSLPAARLAKTGTPTFETARGSQRALQRFATFKTGFEQIYEDLAKQQALVYGKGFAEKIKTVGVKPKGLKLDAARKLAEDMLTDFGKANIENLNRLREHVAKAAEIRYVTLGPSAGKDVLNKINKALKVNEIDKNVDTLIASIKAAGLSTYDVVKSMDKIQFLNVYDVLQKVLKGGPEPLKGLGQKPGFDKSIRDYEKAINQVVQTLPLIEPGRPRRGYQQENVVNLLTRMSDVYAGEKRLEPEAQKDFIKDLNIRFNEMIKSAAATNQQILQEGMRTISTLGIPEALAGKVEFYRPGGGDPGTRFLGALDAVSTKMYTDILPELAPFGAQFTQLGRNIAGVTNAISSSKSELDRLSQEFKATTLGGFGTEFPGLRTERESELVAAGRLGTKGYGFNVLTELRHTAGTMEDQILVSGRMAKALTAITKTLVRPSPGGRIRGGLETAPGVSELQAGPIKDVDIKNVLNEIQEVLGVPERYKGRADRAFIDEIRRAITVVRGEEVEVQQARLTEIFLNAFGRKLTTRFGAKGVSVTPGGLGGEEAGQILKILQAFPKAKVKVLTEEERGQAGLGVAVLPRSMGELLSDIFDKYRKQLEREEFDVTILKKMLIASGNKFVLEMFKDAEKAIVVPEEAAQQRRVFTKAAQAFEAITGQRLAGDKAAIGQIRDLFTREVGGGLVKERAIDVRISSVGVGKRGLQPEVLETILGNITGVGERGFTTIPTKFSQEQYQRLLGGAGKAGELSKISKSLGFETVGTPEQIRSFAEAIGAQKGKDPEMAKIIARRAEALETMSNYYTTIIDEFGEARKSIVGEKFLSIVQETGETEAWRKEDIRRGVKGASVDIPVFSAYATVFGEQSKLIQEISESTNANQRKQLEFLKALQFMADETGTLQNRQLQFLDKASLNAVKYFDQSTGILGEMADELDPRSLQGTIFDVKKFPKPFFLDIPKTGGAVGETEPFYVPGALARGTYAEELIGGERGVEDIGRRLQHVVNMAKKATELLDRPAVVRGEIETLEEELGKLLRVGDPRSAQIETQLLSRRAAETRLLSGEGQMSNIVKQKVTEIIGDFLKEAQSLRFQQTPEAGIRVKEIYSIIINALSKVEAPAEAFRVKRGVALRPGASEFENVEAFLKRQLEKKGETAAFADAIGKASDILIGKGPGAQDVYNTVIKGIAELQQGQIDNISIFKEVLLKDFAFKSRVTADPSSILNLLQEKQRLMQSEMQATENQLFRLAGDIRSGKGLELAAKLGVDVEKELQFKYEQALDNLQKAKIDYFHSLAQMAVGKTGAIGTAVFSRKFPAVMKKATSAIVDRTEEFSRFRDILSQLKGKLPEDALAIIDRVISQIGDVAAEHGKRIGKQRQAGFPVLRQHELGIPAVTAKKLPVEFEKRIQFGKGGARGQASKIEGTLFDLLNYREQLQKLVGDEGPLAELAKQELERTKTFVEAIRYPFTGVSSIVPYEAKLLKGQRGSRAFSVPGAPELDVGKLGEIISPIEDIISGLAEQRESLFRQADITGQLVDAKKIDEITALMDELAAAVAGVIPKYAAHTAKLDFDGDEIAVHTARTKEARDEIRAHHKTLTQFNKGLQSVYRDVFTAGALESQQPTGQAILAEMAESFYKKFPKEKGFEFLVRPFLTGQAAGGEVSPTLEYAGRGEKLSILGLENGIARALEDTILATVEGVRIEGANKDIIIEALENVTSPFKDIEEEMASVKKAGGIEERITFAEDLYKAIEDLDKALSTSFVTEIQNVVTSRLFESKYRDAVEAQLFKIHTGIETEALYRLSRLSEANVGFGGGFARTGAAARPSAGFAGRHPSLQILGGTQQAVAEDFFAKFNEVFRFALQKGMDVKHAGGRTIAGEIERNIASGGEGITSLWNSIIDTSDETFGELRDFSDVIGKTTKMRLGELPTETIRQELGKLYEARGTEYSPAELAKADREKIMSMAAEATGLKAFFEEMAIQVREAAIEGIIKQISGLSPEKRGRIGDPESYAKNLIAKEIEQGGINIREHVIAPKLPLYMLRQETGLGRQEKRFKERYGEVGVPENVRFLRKGPEETENILKQYKQAKATAQNIQDALADAAQGLGGGAYTELVKSTLTNIHRDQTTIENEFKKLTAEGFDISKIDRSLDYLSERVISGRDLPKITSEILKEGPEEQAKELERLADLVGIPTLTREEKLDVSEKLFKNFRKRAEAVYAKKPDLSEEDVSRMAEEYAMKMADAASVVYEMDRIIDVLGTRAQEGITLLSLFPEPGTAARAAGPGLKKSYAFGPKMRNIAEQGQAMREAQKGLYGPTGGGIGGGAGMGGGFPMGRGDVVPVHIHSIAQGIGVFLGEGAMPKEQLKTTARPRRATGTAKEIEELFAGASVSGQAMREGPEILDIDPALFAGPAGPTPEEKTLPKSRVKAFTEPLKAQFQAIQELHDGSIALQTEIAGLDFDETLSRMHKDIQSELSKGKQPPIGPEFAQTLEALTKGGFISFQESMKAWQLWRIAMGDFLISQAREAEQVFDIASQQGLATREFASFQKRVDTMREFIIKSLGKRTDIYTRDRRFLLPEKAEEAGVFATPKQLFEKSAQPFGEDVFTRGVYKDLLGKLEAGTLGAPAEEIRKIVDELADVDVKAKEVLEDIELFERMGKDAVDAWDFEKVAKRSRVLREALSQYAKSNLSDEFQVDVEKKFQVKSLLQYLKQIEQVYGKIDLGRLQRGDFGKYETGAIKVPKFLPPGQQMALQRRNLQRFREFAARPEKEGGPAIGESFSQFIKVTDQAGNVLKSVRVDFKKYGETADEANRKIGLFTEVQTDLIDKMHMSGGTFRSATKRVIMWGAAATLVYGGVQALKDSIDELADIETGIAQLRMVMNPLETNFDRLTASAVEFAKSYGVAVGDVVASMKIFAQQGLKQTEVVDRARVSTLAANVTTLSAGDATEALTAAMKSFGNEIGSADMALDAWSETEARHAITAADMANAIKKSAAAAKNAGFTFNELNGIVAGIGAVTRQTGKEVGTAMRFIARRIFSEKGPKELAQIGIPTVTGEGEYRRGFDILSDLAVVWDDLTNAQKLNISQSIGGTRQYNALLVAMDNWNEVLDAIEDSTNSKGSAERRNVEIMKTYSKQMAQTKAAAVELKLELGKFVFPVFKAGLKALKLLFEVMSSIPAPVKAAGVALGLFFTYASKGLSIFDGLVQTFDRGRSAISNFSESVGKEFTKAKFEILGKGFGPDIKGLKTFAKAAPATLRAMGLDDLHSGFGKLIFTIKKMGDSYNAFLAGTGQGAGTAGKGMEELGKDIKNVVNVVDTLTDAFQLVGLGTAPLLAVGTQIVESLAKGVGVAVEQSGKLFGASGRKIAEFMAEEDPSLFKSLAPLVLTIGAAIPMFKNLAGAMDRSRKSAQEYAQSVYNVRRIEEDQIKSLTDASRKYEKLQRRLESINKVITTPGLKEKQQASDKYTAPMLALAGVQDDATKLANELAKVNNKLVIGYDDHGDAILRLTGNYQTYLETLQRASSLELAKTDIDVLKKYVESLTDVGLGESIKSALKTTLGEIPGVGGLLEGIISVSPGKEMETITDRINELLALRERHPLSDAFDQDINRLQEALGKVKNIYDETASDFKKTLAGIFKFEGAGGLDRHTIARLLADPELTKGFELLIELEPKISEVNRTRLTEKVRSEDVIGSEILKRIFPAKKAFIDYTAELTAAQAESAGIISREGRKVAGGDIVTFFPELAREFEIAGAQAVVELKKTTDGLYEAFVTYINAKTLKVEQRPLDDPDLMNIVDRIFPSGRIQTELENRLDALNTFVAGAAAGLVGIEPKKFKSEFDLGARFYSELPTTTALQAQKGFNVQTREFGELPQLQRQWADMTRDFFIEPMAKYNREVQSLTKNTLDGLDDAAQLTKDKAEELYDQQAILRNNQVIAQFAAVFADLSKSMEESTRILKENLAVEKVRQEAVRYTSGLMKGLPEGFDNIDTGIRKIQDLSVKQLAALTQPEYREAGGEIKLQQIIREGAIGELASLEKIRVAIETIFATQKGFGSIVGPEGGPKAVAGFIEKAVVLQDVGMATLSQDINNLDGTSRKGFDDVVERLETMIANQGDLTGFEDAVGVFEREAAARDTGVIFANELAKQLHKTAEARTRAEGKGDAQAAATFTDQINRLVDVMVSERGLKGGLEALRGPVGLLGLPKAGRGGVSGAEFQQRAFRKLQIGELTERFKTELPKQPHVLTPFLSPKEIKKSLRGVDFAQSKEYKQLITLQEKAAKLRERSFLDSKTILKGSLAITAFEEFNKKSSNKILDNLNTQLSQEEKRLVVARKEGDIDIPEIENAVASLKKAVAEQEKSLKFHGLISALSKITGGVTALSRVLGVSETNLKRMNVAAVGTYLAMQAASKVTGKDIPESAREFGAVLKEAIGEIKKDDFTKETGKRLRAVGAKFEEAYGERVREITGKTKEAVDEQINERISGIKKLSDAEIEMRAKQIKKEAVATGGGTGIKAILAALTAATIGGAFVEIGDRGIRNAELERLAEQTSDVFNKIIERSPEAADIIAQELINQVKKQAAAAGADPRDVETQNQLLDISKEYNNALESIGKTTEKTKRTIEDASKAMEELADSMYKFEIISELNKSMRDFIRSMSDAATEFEVRRQFGGPGILSRGLAGFPGEVELPIGARQMSTQQRLFSTMGEDFQTSVSDYSYGLQAVNSLVEQLATATKRRRDFIENNIEDPEIWEKLENGISATKESINEATNVLGPFGQALNNIVQYSETVEQLNDAFNDIAAKQAVETMVGFRQFRDDMDKLLGGAHPGAVIGITPEQERMGRGVGVQLRQFESTRFDLERAQLLNQLRTSSGQERQNIAQRLRDLPESRRRTMEEYRQRGEIGRLREQVSPFEQALVDVQKLRQVADLPDEVDKGLRKYQESIVGMLGRATEQITRADLAEEVVSAAKKGLITEQQLKAELTRIAQAGPKQFRGTLVTGTAAIGKQQTAVYEALRKELPTTEMSDMKVAITDPIVEELGYQTEILKAIAEKGLDVSQKFLERPTVKPFASEAFEAPERPGFFRSSLETLRNVLSPLRRYKEDVGRATGGKVFGEGGPKEDKVPAMLSPGEYVIRQAAASKLGLSDLEHINKYGEVPKFQDGGGVGSFLKGRAKSFIPETTGLVSAVTGWIGGYLKGQGNWWEERRLAKAKEGWHTWPGQVLDLPGEWSGDFLGGTLLKISDIFKFIQNPVQAAGQTAESVKKTFDTIKKNPVAAYKAMDYALAEEWKKGGTDLLNPFDFVFGGRMLGKMTSVSKKAPKVIASSIKHVSNVKKIKALEGGIEKLYPGAKITLARPDLALSGGPGITTAEKLASVTSGATVGPQIKYIENLKRASEFATKAPNMAKELRELDIWHDPRIWLGNRAPKAGSFNAGARRLFLDPMVAKKGTRAHEFGGHFAQDLVNARVKELNLIGRQPSKELLKLQEGMKLIGEGPPISKYAAAYKNLPFLEKQFGKAIKKAQPKRDLQESLKEFAEVRYKQENFAEFSKLGSQKKLSSGMQAVYDKHYAPEKLDKVLGRDPIPMLNEYRDMYGNLPGFAGGGVVGSIKGWLKTAKEFYFGRDVLATEEELQELSQRGGMSYLTSKETKGSILDVLDPEGYAAGGLAKIKRSRDILKDENVQRTLREPGIEQQPADEAIFKAYGLDVMQFDKRRGTVGFKGLPGGRISYHDLREMEYQDIARAMEEGQIPGVSIMGRIHAKAKGMVATAGEDPATKAALEKAEIEKKALRSRIFDIKPGDKLSREAGLHYGRETELLLPIYHKLKAKVEDEKSTDTLVLRNYDLAAKLLGKEAITDPADLNLLGKLVADDKKGLFAEKGKPIIESEAIRKAIENAKSMQDYEKLQRLMGILDTSPEQATKLAESMGIKPAGTVVQEATKKELSKFNRVIQWLKSPSEMLKEKRLKKADGGSIPFYQSGGVISQSGPVYAHKGEFILPKGMQNGGLVENDIATAALKEGTIKLEDNGLADKIAEKIKEAIETSEVKIDEDAVIKVDVTDVSVPVDIGDATIGVDTTNATVSVDPTGTTVPVDTASVADAIGDAISRALANASVDVNVNQVGGQAVGADRIDELNRTIQAVDDRVLEIKDDLETKIESVRGDTITRLEANTSTQIDTAMSRVQQDVNDHTNKLSYVNGQISRFEHQMDHRIREVDRIAKDAQNLAQRPPAYTPSF